MRREGAQSNVKIFSSSFVIAPVLETVFISDIIAAIAVLYLSVSIVLADLFHRLMETLHTCGKYSANENIL